MQNTGSLKEFYIFCYKLRGASFYSAMIFFNYVQFSSVCTARNKNTILKTIWGWNHQKTKNIEPRKKLMVFITTYMHEYDFSELANG